MFDFPKKQRLLDKKAFDVVFNHAERLSNRNFVLLFHKSCLDHPRVGLIIPKRIISKAVMRNRVKRALRESFRLNRHIPDVDVVILAKKALRKHPLDLKQLRASIDELWDLLSMRYANSSVTS